jgi:putative holliday junction resolvase
MERISALGLDVGRKRVGIAGCDGLGLMATGLTILTRKSFEEDLAFLRVIIADRQVQRLVVGLPYTLTDGQLGTQARQTQKYADRLGRALSLPVDYVDERLTSVEAEEQMRAEGLSISHNKAVIDRKAAAIILQQWLEARR